MKVTHQLAVFSGMFPTRMGLAASATKSYTLRGRALAFVVLGGIAVGSLHAETISSRRLVEVTDLGNPVMSLDGRYVAFRAEQASVARNTFDTAWYVERLDGKSTALRVADGGAPLREYVTGLPLPSPAVWSPDGKWLYYRALHDGHVSVWRAAVDGSGSRELTTDPADVRDFNLSGDGQTLRYSVGATREEVVSAEESEYDRGIRIDDTVNIGAGLFRSSKLDGRRATQRFLGDWFSTGPLLAKVPGRWKVVDLATMKTRDLPASELPAAALKAADLSPKLPALPTKLAQSPGDARIAVLVSGKKDKGRMMSPSVELAMLSDRHASQLVVCKAKLCLDRYITDIQWRPASDEVLFTTMEFDKGRTQSIYGWNVVTGAVRPIVLASGLCSGSQRYWDAAFALSSDTLVCVAAEADRPPRLEAIDLTNGQRRIVFEPNQKLEADIAATVPARLIRWKDARGREFTGQLFEARGASLAHPPPLFVTFYTCDGFLRGGLGDEWPLATLADDGISALCINAIPADLRLDVVANYDQGRAAVDSVVKALSAEGRIDPNHVGMGGLSFGSEVTLWTLAHSDAVTAASVSGISVTPTYYLFNSLRDAFRSNLRQLWGLGAPNETPSQWKKISPAYQLDKIKAPILFQLPEQEFRMTLDYALPLVRRHQADIYVFPDETHIKFQPAHKLAVYERNVDWFRFWLQRYEDPDPAKATQYSRWRDMRKGIAKPRSRVAVHVGS
jgi:dipeptidyl aminopeptidase/acylaminoacyl peptidase